MIWTFLLLKIDIFVISFFNVNKACLRLICFSTILSDMPMQFYLPGLTSNNPMAVWTLHIPVPYFTPHTCNVLKNILYSYTVHFTVHCTLHQAI